MDLTRLLVQLVIALICAGIATLLLPRKVPGKMLGLLLIGLAGVMLGEWVVAYLQRTFSLSFPPLEWSVQDVPIVPAIAGSAVVLYVVTAFLSWGRYNR